MKHLLLCLLVLPLLFGAAFAKKAPSKALAESFPSYFTIPAQLGITNGYSYEDFGEATFYVKDNSVVKQGKHWHSNLAYKNPPAGADGKALWALIKPSLTASGWTVPDEYDTNPFSAMIRYQKDGKDTWAYMELFSAEDIRMDIVETGAAALTFALTPPAATPEKFAAEKGDYPWLSPLPGSKFRTGARSDGPMHVTLPGSDEEEIVGSSSTVKDYAPPPNLSTISFVNQYKTALTKAGWAIIETSGGIGQTDATVTAHYAKNGRNIWAYLHFGGGEYSVQVADADADDLAASLAKSCHVALYGVLFDFNKSTLKKDSDPVLQKVLSILQKDVGLKLEVQGHTDNVGGDDYNQKLSEARAKSVMAWLTSHGVPANRLTAKGYGKTMPVASNDSDDGRAKNRRVEIAKPGCVKR